MAADRLIYRSWGGLSCAPETVARPTADAPFAPESRYLAYGNGRSYGDSCFPASGALVETCRLDGVRAFDPQTGEITVGAGLLLGDLIGATLGSGWFPPVLPGTRFVTVGGAIANDVHGKNHHVAGSFGRHVAALSLARSDGRIFVCGPGENAELFRATIGGMGLTGLITTATIRLKRVASPDVVQTARPLEDLDAFLRHAEGNHAEYAVAWVDSLARGRSLGRGVLLSADHAAEGRGAPPAPPRFRVPFTPPVSAINSLSLRAFNALYRRAALRRGAARQVGWAPFFFPLDGVSDWNRLYGPRGLRQHQSVVPFAAAGWAVPRLFEATHQAGHGSFLTVLKAFANEIPAAGLLSFARPGVTLTLDFPYRGAETDRLLARLDEIALGAGGAVNPYKDARMSRDVFRASFPGWREILPWRDPMAGSMLAERVGLLD